MAEHEMTLEEAASRIQTLLNFHKGLQKLDEVIELGRATVRLQKEREDALRAITEELTAAQVAFSSFQEKALRETAEAENNLSTLQATYNQRREEHEKALQAAHDERCQELEKSYQAEQARVNLAIQDFRKKQAQAQDEHDMACKKLDERKRELENQVAVLENTLATLKVKIGSI